MGTTPGYDAADLRRSLTGYERGEGVSTYNSYRVSQRAAGANQTIDVNQDEMAFVRGDSVTQQQIYDVAPHNATINESVVAADPTNPRIDRVVLEVKDNTHDASGSSLAQTRVIAGTPTSGATLDNLNGVAAVPNSALLLADVLVPAASSSVTTANIRDRRAFVAGIPPVKTAVDMVPLLPVAAGISAFTFGTGADLGDLEQAAYLVRLERRIVSATRIRWKYKHSATAAVGNYALAIFDASGRLIVSTGSVAFTGALNTLQQRSETITATSFEAGLYYVFMGLDTSAGAGSSNGVRLDMDNTTGDAVWPVVPNVGLRLSTGGVTVPTTLAGLTDLGSFAGPTVAAAPLLYLSVG